MAGNDGFDPVGDDRMGKTSVHELLLLLCEQLNNPTYESEAVGYVNIALNTALERRPTLTSRRIFPLAWRLLSYLSLPGIYIHRAVDLDELKKGQTPRVEVEDDGTRNALLDAFYRVIGPTRTQRLRRPGNDRIRHMFIPFFGSHVSAFVHIRFDVGPEDEAREQICRIHVIAPPENAEGDGENEKVKKSKVDADADAFILRIQMWLDESMFHGMPSAFVSRLGTNRGLAAAPRRDVNAAEATKGAASRRNLRLLHSLSYLREVAFGRPDGFGTPEGDLFGGSLEDAPPAAYRNRVQDCNDLLELAARAYCAERGQNKMTKEKDDRTAALEKAIEDCAKKMEEELLGGTGNTQPDDLQGDEADAVTRRDELIAVANALVYQPVQADNKSPVPRNDPAEMPPNNVHRALPYFMFPVSPAWYIHSAINLSDEGSLDEPQRVVGGRPVARRIRQAFKHSKADGTAKPAAHSLKHLLIPLYQDMAAGCKVIRYYSLLHYTFESRTLALHQLSSFDTAPEGDANNRKPVVADFVSRFRFADLPDYCYLRSPDSNDEEITTLTVSAGSDEFLDGRHHYSLWHVVQAMHTLITSNEDNDDASALAALQKLKWDHNLGIESVQLLYCSLLHALTRAGHVVTSASSGASPVGLISWLQGPDNKRDAANGSGGAGMDLATRSVFVRVMDAMNAWHSRADNAAAALDEVVDETDDETTTAVKREVDGRPARLAAQAKRRTDKAQRQKEERQKAEEASREKEDLAKKKDVELKDREADLAEKLDDLKKQKEAMDQSVVAMKKNTLALLKEKEDLEKQQEALKQGQQILKEEQAVLKERTESSRAADVKITKDATELASMLEKAHEIISSVKGKGMAAGQAPAEAESGTAEEGNEPAEKDAGLAGDQSDASGADDMPVLAEIAAQLKALRALQDQARLRRASGEAPQPGAKICMSVDQNAKKVFLSMGGGRKRELRAVFDENEELTDVTLPIKVKVRRTSLDGDVSTGVAGGGDGDAGNTGNAGNAGNAGNGNGMLVAGMKRLSM